MRPCFWAAEPFGVPCGVLENGRLRLCRFYEIVLYPSLGSDLIAIPIRRRFCVAFVFFCTQYDADNDGLLTEKEWRAYLKASETDAV